MSNFRDVLLAGAALCAGAPTALAAPALANVQPPSWTGFDVGVQGDFGWGGESDNLSSVSIPTLSPPPPPPPTPGPRGDHFSANGALGGAYVGYNRQFDRFVVGIRAELDASGLNGSTTAFSTYVPSYSTGCSVGCTVTDASLALRNIWQAFLLARAGVAFDRWLVYLAGGLALANDRETLALTQQVYAMGGRYGAPALGAGSQTRTLVGGAIGLGAQYAVDDHWRVGAEWRYVDFPRASYSSTDGLGDVFTYKAGFSENLGLATISYGF